MLSFVAANCVEASSMNLDGYRHQKSKVEAAYLEASTGLTSGGLTSGAAAAAVGPGGGRGELTLFNIQY